jgi:hypothetical protein
MFGGSPKAANSLRAASLPMPAVMFSRSHPPNSSCVLTIAVSLCSLEAVYVGIVVAAARGRQGWRVMA